ncbi:MAG: hypothetical protein M1475_05155 [Actinobacteria bacterium]|nr:hypothetical protein [Actinomycetota bacterium]
MGGSSLKSSNYPKIQAINKDSKFLKRHYDYSFFFRILKTDIDRREEIVEDRDKSNDCVKFFEIKFNNPIEKGQEIKYCWGFSAKNLFACKKKELSLKRDKEKFLHTDCEAAHVTDTFDLSIFFEHGYPLKSPPQVEVFKSYTGSISIDSCESYTTIFFNQYELHKSGLTPGDKITAKWNI